MANIVKWTQSDENGPSSRGLGLARLAGALATLAVAAAALPTPWSAAAWTTARSAADVVTVAALLAGSVLVWALLTWATLIGGLSLIARLPGTVGRRGRRWLARVAPIALRRVLLTAVGASLITGVASGVARVAEPTAPVATARAAGPSVPVTPGPAGIRATPAAPAADRADHGHAQLDRAALATPSADRAGHGHAQLDRAALAVSGPVGHAEPAGLSWPGAEPPARSTATAAAPLDIDWPAGSAAGAGVTSPARAATADGTRATGSGPSVRHAAAAVVVLRGDTLWSIAASRLPPGAPPAAIDAAWRSWYAANRAVIGDDPDLILPGQQLLPPSTQAPE